MPKRQHDTNIWDEDWFIKLPWHHQRLFLFVKDKCDCAGIWKVNLKSYELLFETQVNQDDFLQKVNSDCDPRGTQRLIRLDANRWLLTGFISFQYGNTLNPKNQAHKGAIRRILENGIPTRLLKGINNPQVFDIKYVAKDKSILTLESEATEDKNHIDYQQVNEIEPLFNIEGPSKALQRPSEGLKDKDKDKEYYIGSLIENNNTLVEKKYSIEEKKVQLQYSVPVFQMPEINFCYDGSQQSQEIEKFLKLNFQPFAMVQKLADKGAKGPMLLKEIIEDFIQHIQSRNEYQTASEMLKHMNNWYRRRGERIVYSNPPSKEKEIISTEQRNYSGVTSWKKK